MKLIYKKDYDKEKKKPKVSGHRDGMIYGPIRKDRDDRPIQYVRQMPSHYNDAQSGEQLQERYSMQCVMQLHHILKDAYQGCFEGKGRSYTRFISANRKAGAGHIVISQGSLPPLHYTIKDDEIHLEYHEEDWQPGDILRQVRATINGKDYFALIHLRPTETSYLSSSQELVETTASEEEEIQHIAMSNDETQQLVTNLIETICLIRLAFSKSHKSTFFNRKIPKTFIKLDMPLQS